MAGGNNLPYHDITMKNPFGKRIRRSCPATTLENCTGSGGEPCAGCASRSDTPVAADSRGAAPSRLDTPADSPDAFAAPVAAQAGGSPQGSDPFSGGRDFAIARALKHIRHTLFIMSGKGGVGKSSVTVNLASALALKGYRVGVMDVDLHGPSVPNLFGLHSRPGTAADGKRLLPVEFMPNLHIISMDSLLADRNASVLWRGPKKTAAIKQFLSDVVWGELDFLLVDSPPGTGDEHLTILKNIPDIQCVVVTTPQEISLADVRKAMDFLRRSHARVLGLVENMSGLSCPNCGVSIPLFKTGGGKLLAEQYQVPFLGAVALDPLTVVAADAGIPVVCMQEESRAKRDFLILADAVDTACRKGSAIRMEP